jgi:hypothetical protein
MTIKLKKEEVFKNILGEKGSPYLSAIILLEELIDQYNKIQIVGGENCWEINYKDLEERYRFSYGTIKLAFRILEKKYNFIKITRSFKKTPEMGGGSKSFISLNISNLAQISYNES